MKTYPVFLNQKIEVIVMKKIGGLLVMVFGLILTANVQSTNAQGAEKIVTPYSETIVHPCNGEVVDFEGTFQEILHINTDANGGFHGTSNWNVKAKGEGDLGNEYNLNYNDNFGLNFTSGGAETFTNTATFNVVGKGKAPNFKIKLLIHTTVNSNGVLTSEVDTYAESCK